MDIRAVLWQEAKRAVCVFCPFYDSSTIVPAPLTVSSARAVLAIIVGIVICSCFCCKCCPLAKRRVLAAGGGDVGVAFMQPVGIVMAHQQPVMVHQGQPTNMQPEAARSKFF